MGADAKPPRRVGVGIGWRGQSPKTLSRRCWGPRSGNIFLLNYTRTKEVFNVQITVSLQTQPVLEQMCWRRDLVQTWASTVERGG